MFQDVEANTDEDPILFKAQLFALTGVQPEKQKVMLKGAILGDESWGKIKLRDGAMMLMMGTKDEDMPEQPVEKTKFIEDMDERELSKAMDMPAGRFASHKTDTFMRRLFFRHIHLFCRSAESWKYLLHECYLAMSKDHS